MKRVIKYQNKNIDKFVFSHSLRVSKLCEKLSILVGLSKKDIDEFKFLADIHDIGKIKIPNKILMKPGSLTKDEFIIVKKHVQYALDILSTFGFNESDIRPIIEHHERCDGSGYPKGLVEKEISTEGKILGIIDVFEALYSKRPYKEPWSRDKIKKYFKENREKFCDKIFIIFLEHFDEFCNELDELDD